MAASTTAINRTWIVAELTKLIAAERAMAADVKSRAESPPDPSLTVLYHEIAADDERHVTALETIAIRYGYTPSRSEGLGVGETLGRLKDKVAGLGTSAPDRLGQDLLAKADAIHRQTAWAHALEALGDAESARDLAAVLTEDQKHRDALLESLKRMIEQGARENHEP
jgi:hypothetical protein